MPWNSKLGASGALSNGHPVLRSFSGQRYEESSPPPPSNPPAPPPPPPPTFLQRRRENWLTVKNSVVAYLQILGFLIFVIDDEFILPLRMKSRRHLERIVDYIRPYKRGIRNKLAMEERRKNEPRPLPRRRRALSATHLDLSQNSALLSLPREIRLQIYSHIIGYDLLHLVQLPKRLGHIRCHQPSSSAIQNNEPTTDIFWDINRRCPNMKPHDGLSPYGPYAYGEPLITKGTSSNSLSLLQTSRQTYTDASHILYTTNTFDISHPQTLLFLERTLLPYRLASIKTLQLKWLTPMNFLHKDRKGRTEPDTVETWDKMCEIILTKMTGLRHVRLVYTSLDPVAGNLPLVLKLRCEERIPGLESFEIWQLFWREGEEFMRIF